MEINIFIVLVLLMVVTKDVYIFLNMIKIIIQIPL